MNGAVSPMLDVRNLSTEFRTSRGPVHAVNDVSFSVRRGEIVGIVGESWCGKSATIRSILGLIRLPGRITGGEVLLNGRDLTRLSARKLRQIRGSKIGFVPQNPFGSLNPVLRIGKQFHNVLSVHAGTSPKESRKRALAMLEAVGIADPPEVLGGYGHQLSGGMAQRVLLSIALSMDPKLVVADEPTTALDVTVQRQILELMRSNIVGTERSMLLVTHDLGVVAQYCDRVIVMYAGKVVESGPVGQVFHQPAMPYTLALLEAIPRRDEQVRSLKGTVPDLINYPTGCPYKTRCRFYFDRCDNEVPELLSLKERSMPERSVACHLRGKEVMDRATVAG